MGSKLIVVATFVVLAVCSYIGFNSLYQLNQKIEERKRTKISLEHKIYPIQYLTTLDNKPVSNDLVDESKLLIHLSVKCPHCLEVVKSLALDSNNTSITSKILPVFKAQPAQIDSFAKANNIEGVDLFHVKKNSLSDLIKAVPAFLLLDGNNRIKKASFGIPSYNNHDSTLVYVKNLANNSILKHSGTRENCQQ